MPSLQWQKQYFFGVAKLCSHFTWHFRFVFIVVCDCDSDSSLFVGSFFFRCRSLISGGNPEQSSLSSVAYYWYEDALGRALEIVCAHQAVPLVRLSPQIQRLTAHKCQFHLYIHLRCLPLLNICKWTATNWTEREKKQQQRKENDNDSNKNSLFGWNNFSQQQIGARQTSMKKKRTQHKSGSNMKRKFELRECFVCRREAYKCQVQTNIIVLCGGREKKKKVDEWTRQNVPGQKRIHNKYTHTVLRHSASNKKKTSKHWTGKWSKNVDEVSWN